MGMTAVHVTSAVTAGNRCCVQIVVLERAKFHVYIDELEKQHEISETAA